MTRRVSALNGHKVDRGELASSVDLEIEFESVAFIDTRQAGTFHRADMHEGVFLAIIPGNEAEALHAVEELDRAGCLLASELTLRAACAASSRSTATALFHGNHVTDNLQVGSRNLSAAIDQVKGKFLTFGKTFQSGAFDLADMDEYIFTAFITLDEAETLLGIEEFYLALAGADNLGGHSATARATTATAAEPTAAAAATRTTAEAAATIIVETATAASTETAAAATPVISAKARRSVIREGIETLFTKTVPLVAPPAATTFIVTHEPNVPSLRIRPQLAPGDRDGSPSGSKRWTCPPLLEGRYNSIRSVTRTI
ncbi:hypothetical protein FHS61_000829 [Altererythrobacter atlanticus]|nr:hypothetical protein [Croceibacterium atlanticum]